LVAAASPMAYITDVAVLASTTSGWNLEIPAGVGMMYIHFL